MRHYQDVSRELTAKFVISPIDNKTYCRKNGQFLRHIRAHGHQGYQDWFESTYPNLIRYCACGKKCSFVEKKMSYRPTCGDKECANLLSSKIKSEFTDEQKRARAAKYRTTMSKKSPEELNQIKASRRSSWVNKYGVNHPWELSEIRQKISDTMAAKYGKPNYSSTLIPEDSRTLLENREWLYECHVNQQMPLWKIAETLNVGDRTVGIYLHQHGIPTHSFQRSMWEREIEEFLQQQNIKYLVNYRNLISPKEVDFFLPEYNLAIELCGLYWHSEAQERMYKNYHHDKYKRCKAAGVQLLTIFEDEWKNKKTIILSTLMYKFNKINSRHFARNLIVVETVDAQTRNTFLTQHHIQGNGDGSHTLGLQTKQGEIVAVAVFAKVANSPSEFYLTRFSTSGVVVGGFSKIIHHFAKQTKCKSITTFADNRWSTGALYEKNGFERIAELKPDYAYIVKGERVHKFNFRHRSLKKMLPNYNEALSERDNCMNHGLYRIWDCGKGKYKWNNNLL